MGVLILFGIILLTLTLLGPFMIGRNLYLYKKNDSKFQMGQFIGWTLVTAAMILVWFFLFRELSNFRMC